MIRLFAVSFFCLNVVMFILLKGSGESDPSIADSLSSLSVVKSGNELILVSELDSESITSRNEVLSPESLKDSSSVVSGFGLSQCFSVGDFYGAGEAQRLAENFENSGFVVSTQIDLVEAPGSFVVYVEPFDNEEQARVQLLNLRSLGVDSFVITEGSRSNGISLGVFATDENASEYKAGIDAKGYGYKINTAQFYIEKERYRLFLKQVDPPFFDESDLVSMVDIGFGASIEQKPCNEVAS